MGTKQRQNQNRYRAMRSAILTGSLLSILPLFVLMKNATGGATASVVATNAQAIAAATSPTQTTSSQNTASQAAATSRSTSTQVAATPVTASTPSNTSASAAMTYTRTKAS